MPKHLRSSDPADLEPIRRIIQDVVFFFNLRVVEGYMALGQEISNQSLFFGEDPYYLVAVCDLSEVILWLFDRAKQHGMQLVDLAGSEDELEFFHELARRIDLPPDDSMRIIPKKVALDGLRLAWFAENQNRSDSLARLFFKLTSLIK